MPILSKDDTAPDFVLPDLDGRVHSLMELQARKPALLCFYKTECATSAIALRITERIHDALGDQAQILGIAQNTAVEVRPFVATVGMSFPQLLDDEPYAASQQYRVEITPSLFLVDPTGKIVATAEAWHREQYNKIARCLAEKVGRTLHAVAVEGDGTPAMRPG